MQVIAFDGGMAVCERRGRRERLNALLVGEPAEGTWILAYQGSAIRVLTAEEAAQTDAALDSLAAALAGESDLDAYFADLIDREPQLPAHLEERRR